MSTDLDIRPARLWRQMPDAQRLLAARAFWNDEAALDQQVEAVDAIARSLKFRAKTVVNLPLDKKARYLSTLANVPDAVAARALVSYHFDAQRAMMAAFLDELGIAHENGLIKEETVARPPGDRLTSAARAVVSRFPADDVKLYLATLASQDPETWGGLREVVGAAEWEHEEREK
jgi:hypothetical protein